MAAVVAHGGCAEVELAAAEGEPAAAAGEPAAAEGVVVVVAGGGGVVDGQQLQLVGVYPFAQDCRTGGTCWQWSHPGLVSYLLP